MEVELLDYRFGLDERFLGTPADELRRQLREYVAGDRRAFDVEVRYPEGLRGAVMRRMARIPYGETRTYGDLAADLDSAAQAVGQACGANPVPVVVPCHRVVGADALGGFSAAGGVAAKRRLLEFERAGTQTDLDAFR